MNNKNFEKALLYEKQCRFIDAVSRTSKNLSVSLPKVKFWDGYCPNSVKDEVAHIHIEEKMICISNYWLKSLDYDEIDGVAVHETTHLIEASHNQNFQTHDNNAKEDLWHSRKSGDEVAIEDVVDARLLTLKKVRKNKHKK